jgi:hypothetical protein
MIQTLKGKTRAYRKACRAAGMLPDNEANEASEKRKFPIEGPFHLVRDGVVVPPADVRYEDELVVPA